MYRYAFIVVSLVVAYATSFSVEMREEIEGPCACIVHAATVYNTTLVVSVDTMCDASVVSMEMSYKYLHHFGAIISAYLLPTVVPCDRYNYTFPFPPSIVEYVLVSSLTSVLLSIFVSILFFFFTKDNSHLRASRDTIFYSSLPYCVLTGVQFVSYTNCYHTITIPVFVIGFTLNFIATTIGLGLSLLFLHIIAKVLALIKGLPVEYALKTDDQIKLAITKKEIDEIIAMGGDVDVLKNIIDDHEDIKTILDGNNMV